MAGEGVNLLVTPRQNNLEGRNSRKDAVEKRSSLIRNSSVPLYRRASLGSFSNGANSGQNSFGLPSSPNNSQKVIPHYLRASMGSCHDFCKYGRKLTFDAKSRLPLSKRTVKLLSDQPIPGGSPVHLERKKVAMVKHISSYDTETHLQKHKPSPHSKTLSSGSTKIIKREVSLPSKKVEISPKQKLATEKKMTKAVRKSDTMSMKHSPSVQPKAAMVKASPSSVTSECGISKGRRNSIINDGKGKVAFKNSFKRVQGPAEFSSSSRPSDSKTVSSKSRKNQNSNLVSLLKDQNRIQKGASVKPKNEKIPEKTLHIVKTEAVINLFECIQNGDVAASLPTPSDQSLMSLSPPHFSLSPHEEDQVNDEGGGGRGGEEEETGHTDKEASELTDNNDKANLNEKEPAEGNCNRTLKKGRAVEEEEEEETGHSNNEASELRDNNDKANLNEREPAEGNCNRTLNKGRTVEEEEEEETVQTNNEATELPGNNDKANLNEKEPVEDNCNGTLKKGRTVEEEEEEEDEKDEDDDDDDKEEEEETGRTNNEASELTDNNDKANLNEKEPAEGNFNRTLKKRRAVEEEEEEEEPEEEEEEVVEDEDEEEEVEPGNTNNEASELTDSNDKANLNEKEPAEGNCNRTLKKGLAVVLKDKDSAVMKLKFRRGKVVELQSEDNSPRRLRFRRGKVLGVNSDGKANARRNFKKRVVDDKDGTNPSPEMVVLRHQDVHDNKNTQGLFNNVIEKTASKLVESRKSKVRALVGAFETVISLQESKPSSDIVC